MGYLVIGSREDLTFTPRRTGERPKAYPIDESVMHYLDVIVELNLFILRWHPFPISAELMETYIYEKFVDYSAADPSLDEDEVSEKLYHTTAQLYHLMHREFTHYRYNDGNPVNLRSDYIDYHSLVAYDLVFSITPGGMNPPECVEVPITVSRH